MSTFLITRHVQPYSHAIRRTDTQFRDNYAMMTLEVQLQAKSNQMCSTCYGSGRYSYPLLSWRRSDYWTSHIDVPVNWNPDFVWFASINSSASSTNPFSSPRFPLIVDGNMPHLIEYAAFHFYLGLKQPDLERALPLC
jgi:hypothetical protein